MTTSESFRTRLKSFLSQITPERIVGVSGLAVLCASSVIAARPLVGSPETVALGQWFGGLGLNVLAGVLTQLYQNLLTQTSESDQAAVLKLAQGLAQGIQNHSELRREIGLFLDQMDTFKIAEEVAKGNPAVHGWLLLKIDQEVAEYRTDFDQIHTTLDEIKGLVEQLSQLPLSHDSLITPPFPSLVIGREDDLRNLKIRLGIGVPEPIQPLTIIRGWPGVGKTTLATSLAHDADIVDAFSDGVLWASFGEHPNILSALQTWGYQLGIKEFGQMHTLDETIARIRTHLMDKHMLLVIDDIWEAKDVASFKVAGPKCATVITTRFQDVAREIAIIPKNDIYVLSQLDEEKGLELLTLIAPTVVGLHQNESRQLVNDLEGLPLALRVAGCLLEAEATMGWGVTELLTELRESMKLLEAKAPDDRFDPHTGTTPTVNLLLKKSTDRLDEEARTCFAFLGAFAPKPATFDLDAMKAVWLVDDPKPITRRLVDRGLLEPVQGRFQMHAVLAMHARFLLSSDEG